MLVSSSVFFGSHIRLAFKIKVTSRRSVGATTEPALIKPISAPPGGSFLKFRWDNSPSFCCRATSVLRQQSKRLTEQAVTFCSPLPVICFLSPVGGSSPYGTAVSHFCFHPESGVSGRFQMRINAYESRRLASVGVQREPNAESLSRAG